MAWWVKYIYLNCFVGFLLVWPAISIILIHLNSFMSRRKEDLLWLSVEQIFEDFKLNLFDVTTWIVPFNVISKCPWNILLYHPKSRGKLSPNYRGTDDNMWNVEGKNCDKIKTIEIVTGMFNLAGRKRMEQICSNFHSWKHFPFSSSSTHVKRLTHFSWAEIFMFWWSLTCAILSRH